VLPWPLYWWLLACNSPPSSTQTWLRRLRVTCSGAAEMDAETKLGRALWTFKSLCRRADCVLFRRDGRSSATHAHYYVFRPPLQILLHFSDTSAVNCLFNVSCYDNFAVPQCVMMMPRSLLQSVWQYKLRPCNYWLQRVTSALSGERIVKMLKGSQWIEAERLEISPVY